MGQAPSLSRAMWCCLLARLCLRRRLPEHLPARFSWLVVLLVVPTTAARCLFLAAQASNEAGP